MADEQQKHALSALSLLVDAANAQQASQQRSGEVGGNERRSPYIGATAAGAAANGTAQPVSATSSVVDPMKAAAAAAFAVGENSSGVGGGMSLEERAVAFRQAAMAAQLQQQQNGAAFVGGNHSAAAANWEAMELQEALQREMLQREAMRRQQQAAVYMGLGGGSSPFGNGNIAAAQEAEYLQQLRLEALVQQRRQETLAQLALAQELGMSPDVQAMVEAEQLRQAAMMRQEALLQAVAAGNFGGGGNGGMEGILGALAGGISEEGIMQILHEREHQRKLALLAQIQQAHQQTQQGSQTVGSSPALTGASGLPWLRAHGTGMERADLIGSVFAKKEAPEPVPESSPEEVAAAALAQEGSPFATTMVGQDGSKTTILRCGARNMPTDHNVKTAYFVVPEDASHGTELVCSHPKCRKDGPKFRLCIYCKIPVAKRNFAKRHRHVGKIPKSELPPDFDLLLEEEEAEEEKALVEPQIKKWSSQELLDALMVQNVPELQAGGQNIPKPPFTGEVLETIVAKRQQEWDKLLLERPPPSTSEDPSTMAAWVLQLLRASDMEKIAATFTPCVPVPTKNLKNKNPGLKKKKRKLLSKRSKGEEGKAATAMPDKKSSSKGLDPATTAKSNIMESTKAIESSHLEHPSHHNPAPSDDSSTSSEDSVDLRASKKARA